MKHHGRTRTLIAALTLIAGLSMPPAMAGEEGFSPSQKQAIEKIMRDYLARNPEVLIEAVRKLEDRLEAASNEQARNALFTKRDELENDPDTPLGGNPKGDVTIVEFFDYRCGFCKKVFPSVMKLIKEDGNIRFVMKEFPILGSQSLFASRAALAAWKLDKDKYMTFHSNMMKSKGALTGNKVMKIAADSGLDVEKVVKGMSAGWIGKAIEKNRALAGSLNISGTPAFVIGEQLVPGAIDMDTMKQLVSKARKG
ncbi:MAG: DsbA family protein [Rhodospirillales bacterium]